MKTRFPITILVLLALCAITCVTGYIGWSQYYAELDGFSFFDVAYHTLLAFVGDSSFIGEPDLPPLNLWIEVARFTGLFTTISALIGLAAVYLGDQFVRLRAYFRKGHIVMIGVSNFALDMYRDKGLITVFDSAENLEKLTVYRRSAHLLKIAGRITEKTGTSALIGTPDTVVFGDADAVLNVERARVWRSQTDRAPNAKLALRIEDASILRDLQLLSDIFAQATLFSRSETIARALVTSIAPNELALTRCQERVHAVLVGLGSINLAVAEELALRCHHPRLGPAILTIVDNKPDEAKARVRRERPALFNPDLAGHLEINFVGMDALECCAEGQADKLLQQENKNPITAVVVAAGEDVRNAAIAMRLRQMQQEQLCVKAPIFMRSDSLASISAAAFDDLTGGIVPFGGRSLDEDDIALNKLYQKLARAIHERWRKSSDVVPDDGNDWTKMSNAQKRASYRAALSAIDIFLAAGLVSPIGSRVAGLRLQASAGKAVLADKDLIRVLAETEHERWNVERLLEAWRKTDGHRDNEKKRHRLILPYDALVALGEGHEKKDEKNVEESLNEGIEQFQDKITLPCWRMRWRVGVIGPLQVDASETTQAIASLLKNHLSALSSPDAIDLEIITPDAPGFDRVAAVALAQAWKTQTGRPARILSVLAAGVSTIDTIALQHLRTRVDTQEAYNAIAAEVAAQRSSLIALKADGHLLRKIDQRPLGVSDTELSEDPEQYDTVIKEVQDAVMALADDMIFKNQPDSIWTQRGIDRWTRLDKGPALLI
ncbi:hypothetical protein [Ruegeria halocynthiae]|uniref:hypothetical protein n=1 Tax=Ruegeria halocynthiae TaxID=985054 RepID=UPI00056288BA|nr:hypothetical protein [Ruegeria halocynthiae]